MRTPIVLRQGRTVAFWVFCLACCTSSLAQTLVSVTGKGNTADSTGYGSVGYEFRMGKYEVTVGEYTSFLNSAAKADPYGLYSSSQPIARTGSSGAYSYQAVGSDRRPISSVSWFDAARFVNWLNNGAGAGASTETGAYSLGGATMGTSVGRSQRAIFFLPTLDEWYKAAYFDPVKTSSGGYWRFPTKSDVAPGNSLTATANQANYYTSSAGRATYSDYRLLDVGSFSQSPSPFGTFDQGGNVWEWTELVLSGSQRGQRGGSVYSSDYAGFGDLFSGSGNKRDDWNNANRENVDIGFRVAAVSLVVADLATGTQAQAQFGYSAIPQVIPFVKSGAGTLVISQSSALPDSVTIQGGVLRIANPLCLQTSTVSVLAGGKLSLGAGLDMAIGSVSVATGGLLDVQDGTITVSNGLTPAALQAALVSGRGDGSWNGITGITSSAAASSRGARTVGWLDNGDGSATFGFAAPGDATLDGVVDILDVAYFLVSGKFGSGDSATWHDGDFNYDGIVDVLDAGDFLSSGLFNTGSYRSNTTSSVVAVPEPSGLSILVVAVGGMIHVTRRRQW